MCYEKDEELLERLSNEEDWSTWGEVFMTLRCRCEMVWRTHAKLKSYRGTFLKLAQLACPGCGKRGDVASMKSDREGYTL